MSRPAVSGIAVDTLLFSRIGVPLFHRYRVVNRSGTHGAFRGSYMRRLHAFLEESDAASLRRRHRRCAPDIAARMSRTSIRDTEDKPPDVSSRPKVTRRSVSRRPTRPVAVASSSLAREPVRPHRSEVNTIQALMDLARFEGLGDGPRQVHRPWIVSTELPASPDPGCWMAPLRSPSPCVKFDALSSDDSEGSVRLSNLSVTLLCGSDDGHTPVNSDQVLSDEDLPDSENSRQVIRIRDVSPDVQIVDISQVGRAWDSRRTVSKGGSGKRMPLSVCVPATATSGRAIEEAPGLSASDPSPVVGAVDLPAEGRVETFFTSDDRPVVPLISSDGCL